MAKKNWWKKQPKPGEVIFSEKKDSVPFLLSEGEYYIGPNEFLDKELMQKMLEKVSNPSITISSLSNFSEAADSAALSLKKFQDKLDSNSFTGLKPKKPVTYTSQEPSFSVNWIDEYKSTYLMQPDIDASYSDFVNKYVRGIWSAKKETLDPESSLWDE